MLDNSKDKNESFAKYMNKMLMIRMKSFTAKANQIRYCQHFFYIKYGRNEKSGMSHPIMNSEHSVDENYDKI